MEAQSRSSQLQPQIEAQTEPNSSAVLTTMKAFAAAAIALIASAAAALADHPLREFLECQLCEVSGSCGRRAPPKNGQAANSDTIGFVIALQTLEPHGLVKDCSCDFQTVNNAATEFFAPLLQQLQER